MVIWNEVVAQLREKKIKSLPCRIIGHDNNKAILIFKYKTILTEPYSDVGILVAISRSKNKPASTHL